VQQTPKAGDDVSVAGRFPLISVVVFVLNAAKTIERTLSSVTSSDQPSVELLVLDGGSTDGTVDTIRRHESKVAFWRSHRDGSAIIAINEGVRRATGDIICLLPADDWVEPGALDLVAREFAADPELEVLSCGVRFVHHEADERLVVDAEFLDPGVLAFTISNMVRGVFSGGRFIRRRMYQRVGEFDANYYMSNDLDFLIRVCLTRPRAKVLPRLVYTYRKHPESRTLARDPEMDMALMRGNIRVAADHLTRSPLRPDERRDLRGFHGRCCARLAWMSMARGKPIEAVAVLRQAVAENYLWPVQVVYWLFRYVLRSKPLV
jgi:glycosyltransferase involved in cell wall biosynthesis